MIPRPVALLLLSLLALPAGAYRREYRVTVGGSVKRDSEVCFYRALSGRDPFSLFFSYDHVACLPADKVLDLPSGMFHAFARHRDGFVSEHRDYFERAGQGDAEKGYETLETPLVKAGYVDVSALLPTLKAGQSLGVWLAPTPATAGTFFPLVDGESEILVPEGTAVIPLLIADHEPIAAGEVLYLRPGEHVRVRSFEAARTLVVWLKVDTDAVGRAPRALPVPEILLQTSDGTMIKPAVPLYDTSASTNTLLFFRNVPTGAVVLHVRGQFWQDPHTTILLPQGPWYLQRPPVLLHPGGSLAVTWPGPAGAQSSACKVSDEQAEPVMRVTLEQCPGDGPCVAVLRKSGPYSTGTLRLDGVPPGDYRVTASPPQSAAVLASAKVVLAGESLLPLPIAPFRLFGTVRLNGKPLEARLIFQTGTARSDSAGSYEALLAADPLANLVHVTSCQDGRSFTSISHKSPLPNSVFDIDIDLRRLEVSVRGERGEAIPEATVRFSVVSTNADGTTGRYNVFDGRKSDADGQVVFEDVPAAESIALCASHADYPQKCTDPLSEVALKSGKVAITLARNAMHGKVAGHTGRGTIAAVDALGRIVEESIVANDGTFSFRSRHASPEYFVYTAVARPLAVLQWETDPETGEVTASLPPGPVRTVAVSAPRLREKSAFVGLWIGDHYIPLQTLNDHQESRGRDVEVHPNDPLILADILESAPLSVVLGRMPPGDFVDVFTLPQYAGVKRQRVTAPQVTLEP